MESYLKGRKQQHRYSAGLPMPKADAGDNGEEDIISAETMPAAAGAPPVDLVLRDGLVRRIIVHLPDGQRLELDCEYEEGTK